MYQCKECEKFIEDELLEQFVEDGETIDYCPYCGSTNIDYFPYNKKVETNVNNISD